jgi:hypothetical protein
MKDFFMKLYQININKKTEKYNKTNRYQGNPNLKKGMQLHINIKPIIKKRNEKYNKIIVYKQLTPSFIKYLNKIFKNRKQKIFDDIRYNKYCLGDKFTKLFKNFAKKAIIPDKEDLVDSLKYYVYMKIIKRANTDKLYYLLRKAIIRKILNMSKKIGNLNRIFNLIKLTMIHKKILKDRWLLNLIKKWRFIAFVKKMAMKKMELMYKDLHVTYLEMADSVLNEGSPLGPNGANFLHDVNKDKYSFDFYDPYLVKGAKPYKAIKKQYIFEPLEQEIEKTVKIIKETETINKIKQINKNYYDYDYQGNIIKTEPKNFGVEKNFKISKIPIKGKRINQKPNNAKRDYMYREEIKDNGNETKITKVNSGIRIIKRNASNDLSKKIPKNKATTHIRYSKNTDLEDSKMSESSASKTGEKEKLKNDINLKKGEFGTGTNKQIRHPKNGKIVITCDDNNVDLSNGGKIYSRNDVGLGHDYEGSKKSKNQLEFENRNLKNNRNLRKNKNNENTTYYSSYSYSKGNDEEYESIKNRRKKEEDNS